MDIQHDIATGAARRRLEDRPIERLYSYILLIYIIRSQETRVISYTSLPVDGYVFFSLSGKKRIIINNRILYPVIICVRCCDRGRRRSVSFGGPAHPTSRQTPRRRRRQCGNASGYYSSIRIGTYTCVIYYCVYNIMLPQTGQWH